VTDNQVQVVFGADTGELKTAIRDANSALAGMSDQLKKMGESASGVTELDE